MSTSSNDILTVDLREMQVLMEDRIIFYLFRSSIDQAIVQFSFQILIDTGMTSFHWSCIMR